MIYPKVTPSTNTSNPPPPSQQNPTHSAAAPILGLNHNSQTTPIHRDQIPPNFTTYTPPTVSLEKKFTPLSDDQKKVLLACIEQDFIKGDPNTKNCFIF